MSQINYLDVVTMIPIFLVAAYMKKLPMTLAIIFIGICGMLHHYYIDSNRLLYLDLIAISIGFSVYTYYSKIEKNVKKYLYILEGIIISYFLFSIIFDIILTDRLHLLIMGLIWIPNLLFSIKHLSNSTICGITLVLLLYMYSRCLCTTHEYIHLTWPAFHLTSFATLSLVLNNMELIIFPFI